MKIENALEELVPSFEERTDGWDDVLARARRARRRYTLMAALVAALLFVPSGVALRHRIDDLFEGTPPPPTVVRGFEASNKVADLAIRKGFGASFPRADVAEAHGALEVQTADGPEDLWVAPNNEGGTCYFIDWANDPAPNGDTFGFGGCDRTNPPTSEKSIDVGLAWVEPHPTLWTLNGQVHVPATRVEVTFADGSTRTLPVVEGYFLASLDRETTLEQVAAFDASGAEVASWSKPK
jgi:hypothetical protein